MAVAQIYIVLLYFIAVPVKKSTRVVTHDQSTTVSIPGANHDKRHCPSDPVAHNLFQTEFLMINIMKGNGGSLLKDFYEYWNNNQIPV